MIRKRLEAASCLSYVKVNATLPLRLSRERVGTGILSHLRESTAAEAFHELLDPEWVAAIFMTTLKGH